MTEIEKLYKQSVKLADKMKVLARNYNDKGVYYNFTYDEKCSIQNMMECIQSHAAHIIVQTRGN